MKPAEKPPLLGPNAGPYLILTFMGLAWTAMWGGGLALWAQKALTDPEPSGASPILILTFLLLAGIGPIIVWKAGGALFEGIGRSNRVRRFPASPWRWEAAFDRGLVKSGETSIAGGLMLYGALILGSLVLLGLVSLLKEPSPALLAIVLFAAVDAALFWFGLKWWKRDRRFGRAVLRLAQVPFVPGQALRADVVVPEKLEGQAQVALVCIRTFVQGRVTRQHRVRRDTLVEIRRSFMATPTADGTRIAVEIDVPVKAGGEPSEDAGGTWYLDVKLGPFEELFPVPVFRPASDQDVERFALLATPSA